jgi:hypothetical protein
MDYGHSAAEATVLQRVAALVEERGGGDRLRQAAATSPFDAVLDDALAADMAFEAPASLVTRLLVVEEVARLGLPALPGPRLIAGYEVLEQIPSRPVAVADRRRPGPLRIPPGGGLLLSYAGEDAWLTEVSAASIIPVSSSFGYPYGTVTVELGPALPAVSGGLLRAWWHLSMAAEIAGTAQGALQQLTSYLCRREQFGKPLASFQALRHRVAELAVSAQAAMWLAREAAWHGDAHRAGLAAVYARDLAARMAPELVQLGGARSFARDFPLHLYAMRLEGLRLGLGSADRLAGETMDAPRAQTVG